MIDVFAFLGDVRRDHTLQMGVVVSRVLAALGVELVQFLQLGQADGRVHVGHAQVVAQFVVVIAAAHAVVAQHARFLGNGVVIGGEHAALGAGHILGGIQAEGAGAERARAFAVEF